MICLLSAFAAVRRGQVPNPPTVGWECLHDPTDVQIESVKEKNKKCMVLGVQGVVSIVP